MSEANMQVDEAQLAVLADRLARMTDEFTGMKLSLDAVRLTLAEFKNTPKELSTLSAQVATNTKTLDRHSFIVKLFGTVLLLCVGLIGWGWTEKSKYDGSLISLDRRLLLIEYRLGTQPQGEPK